MEIEPEVDDETSYGEDEQRSDKGILFESKRRCGVDGTEGCR